MNISRAKEEIKNAIRAYLDKDEAGAYRIQPVRQRPVLLMGPPGIGKTQVMEQIAGEMDLGLVAYTITHHTRQSAIGLPFIREKTYGGVKCSVTEYTMSEIIASVYDCMEESGKKEGILFIDEINCVSETLAPAMLQFLQGKSFGNRKVPEGWIIVAAGNPPEYNRSVLEFDVVTLDRVKLIGVEADYQVWKKYARAVGMHGSILTYLDIHPENFYRMESTVDGKEFVTARGWEDLSEMIYAYERMNQTVDREVTIQYLRHGRVARDFANYLELYYKYKADYGVDEILEGTIREKTLTRLKTAPFDERLQVTGLLLARLSAIFRVLKEEDECIAALFEDTAQIRQRAGQEGTPVSSATTGILEKVRAEADAKIKAGQNEREVNKRYTRRIGILQKMLEEASRLEGTEDIPSVRDRVTAMFEDESERFEEHTDSAAQKLEAAFDFMEKAFGESQEMVVFITELSADPAAVWHLRRCPCDRYFMYNKSLLFEDGEAGIRKELDRIKDMQLS